MSKVETTEFSAVGVTSPSSVVVTDNVPIFVLLFNSSDILSWLQSYLTNRTSSVRIGRHCSSFVTCTTGVPQRSVLGPLLFTAYVSPIAGIAHIHNIDQQQYADDTQLFISLSPFDYMPDTRCIDSLRVWFCANGMALNPDNVISPFNDFGGF